MSKDAAMILFTVGFFMMFGGVGGVEMSVDLGELVASTAVSVVGCLIMWCGTLGLRNSELYND